MIRERSLSTVSGWLVLPVLLVGFGLCLWQFVANVNAVDEGLAGPLGIVLWLLAMAFLALMLPGLFVVNPNEARVVTLFGRYSGSVKHDGLHWANPLYKKRRISLRIRNFESAKHLADPGLPVK